MLQKKINKALLFKGCNSIHTMFMLENIDVIMCDEENKILYYYKGLKTNKVILPKRNVTRVYETPANYFDINLNEKVEVE